MIAQLNREYLRRHFRRVSPRLISYLLFEGRPLTTRGRWVNPFVFFFLGVLKRLPLSWMLEAPCYVAGMGRSGTTVLGTVLSIHKDVGFLNEPKAVWHSVCPHEDVVGNYTAEPARYRLYDSDATNRIRVSVGRIFRAYRFLCGARVVVDKNPEMIFRIPFLLRLFPGSRIVFLARSGHDACTSVDDWGKKNSIRVSEGKATWWGLNDRKWRALCDEVVRSDPELLPLYDWIKSVEDDQVRAVVEWIVTMREGLAAQARFPAEVMIVRYEDLLQQSTRELGRICTFVGLDDSNEMLDYAKCVLRPGKRYPKIEVPTQLSALFADTSSRLGYEA